MKKIDFSLLDKLNARIDNSGGPPHDGDMEARVTKLELIAEKTSERLGSLEKDVALIRSKVEEFPDHFATKADLHREINSQTWKLVTFVSGFGTALVAATYFITTHVK